MRLGVGRRKSVFLITAGFSTAANLASIGLPTFRWSDWISTANNWITWSLALDYLALWLICRRGRLAERALAAIDAAAILLSCIAVSFGVFFPLPDELEGGALSRTLTTVILVLVTRAVIVPSSARRTFVIGSAASLFPVATTRPRRATTSRPSRGRSLGILWGTRCASSISRI